MLLKDLLIHIPGEIQIQGREDTPIDQLVTDSRKKAQNGLFFCIRGLRFDAHSFAGQVAENGCVALVVDHFVESPLTQVRVENVRSAMAYIAGAFYGEPAKKLQMVAMCGTKGKTTTSFLVKSILEKAGRLTGLIGTTGNMIGQKHIDSNMTTPDPVELHSCLKQMVDAGVESISMEVSAHAIDMHRLDGITYEAACFTNLSQDHLDYFGTMDRYFEVKKSFFTSGAVRNAAINADDPHSESILRDLTIPHLTYGISQKADVYARDIEISEEGVSFVLGVLDSAKTPIHMHLTGMFNVYNALAAASLALILGIGENAIREGLEAVRSVPGRVEVLDTGMPYKVILDYAHSPDALENVLRTVREFTKNRLIALVGCGGDRDHGKRPMMGEIVGRLSDYAILTSDNPRTEDPFMILESIEEGIRSTDARYEVIENRREAIRRALSIAREGDVVILAGKGNETYQEIKGVKYPFDEKIVVQELLAEMNEKGEEEQC